MVSQVSNTFNTYADCNPTRGFCEFLLEDGLSLPEDSDAMPTRTRITNSQLQAEDYTHWEEEEGNTDFPDMASFSKLAAEVELKIKSLGGAVVSKLNWSGPKDTAWMGLQGA